MTPSHTLGSMKRAILLSALMLTAAAPAFAQSTEFGVLVGGSRRFVEGGTAEEGRTLTANEFSFSNNAVDLYWAIELEPGTRLKFKAGRIETPVAFEVVNDAGEIFRRDEDGEVQHASAVIEYRFDEPYGHTGLFGGLGLYRQSGEGDLDAVRDWGFQAGVNADFPISRKYGVITEATYHWSRGPFSPRYFTVTGGFRFGF